MKKLYLLRHAKSSWDHPELDDFERPLSNRGRKSIPVMSDIIKHSDLRPDLILSSPATRAAFTARSIAEYTGFPEEIVTYHNSIYDASASGLLGIIKKVDNKINNLVLVGHNPGLTSLANYLSDKQVDNIPTCGLYGMNLDITSWRQVAERSGKCILYEYPRKQK